MNVFLFFEHQSTSERFMCARILESIARSNRQYLNDMKTEEDAEPLTSVMLPYPFSVILYNGKTPWQYLTVKDVTDIPEGFERDILRFAVIVIDVSELTEEELHRGHPMVQALVWTLRCAVEGTLAENYERILELIAETAGDSRAKDWLTAFVTYISSRSTMPNGKNVLEKVYTQVTQDPLEAKTMTKTFMEELIEEGKTEGKAEGKAEDIIMCLRTRFKKPVPQDICDSVNAYSDLTALDSLLQCAIVCESLEDFRQNLIH
jgi:hypothetical protein